MMQHRFHLLQLKPDTAKQIRKKKREAVSGRNPEKHQQSWIKAEKRSKVNEKEGQEVESRPGKVWWNKWVHFFPLLLFPTSSYYSPLLLGPLLQPPNKLPMFSLSLSTHSPPSCHSSVLKMHSWDVPGGLVVKNLSSNSRDAGLILGWGTKIPHASRQLSPLTATEEKPMPRDKDPTYYN